ncbi:MAG: transglutaminase-like domain-containing protein, partial [Lachnospiraceae bacterium]|nr:transglutaminase-like domain-containing protein [Lachnospiraceae bacterium]
MRWWQKYKKTDPDMNINYGLSIDKSVFNIGENRVFSMLIKGLVIYLLTMGGIGSYLTAIDTPYNGFTLNFTVFITAVICSILYYSYLTENIGYLFFFGIYVFLIYYFRDYINSGFYSVINDTIETISEYLDLDGVTLYNEKIKNTELAVTIAAGVFGVFLNILLNNFISRRVRYIVAIFLVVPLNLIPMYFEAQPDIFYSFMLILGIILSYIMKSSQHFLLHRSERVYEYRDSAVKTRRFGRPKKQKCTGTKTIRYVVDARSMFTNLLTGSLIALGVLLATVALIPESSVGLNGKTNKTRENVLSYVGNFLTLGFAGLFNFYDSTGGLDSGRLGGISAIRFDMQTDLNVTFAPYTDERVYIRNFAGSEYLPYKNMWVRDPADNAVLIKKAESRDDTSLNKSDEGTGDAAIKKSGEGSGDAANKKSGEGDIPENSTASVAKELKRSFDKSKNPDADHLAHGRMDIENVEADLRPYIPYYSDAGNTVLTYGQKESLDFFPDLGDRKLGTTATAGALKPYLNVPHENMESISRLAGLMGLNNDDSAAVIIDKISDYYQKNMPYTLNPGATPRKADFINYFIDKAKKGYCAHFASTAVLLLRYKGIPARYCEGYAIDPETLGLQGEIEKGLKYEDYYQGYNKFGKTRVVKVSATDAEAHAWVEYYDKDYGFRVCEVTPASGDDLSDGVSDIWENI